MAFAGLRGSGDWGTDERPQSFREMILWQDPNGMAPITALLSKTRSQSVSDPQFHWWEEKLQQVRLAINYTTGYVSTDTTLTISSGGLQLVAGDVLQVEKTEATTYDNEHMLVSSVTSDTVIVCKRGVAGTTSAAISNGTYLTKIGNVYEEGSRGPDISQRNPTKYTNYCQIFKTAVGITGTAMEIKTRTGDGMKNDKKRKLFDHSVSQEYAFIFGKPYEDTSGTKPKRYTGGLRHFLSSNVTIFSTTPTEDTFINAIYPCWNYNSMGAGDERIAICGNGALISLNRLVRNSTNTQIRYDGPFKVYGMNLQRWVFPMGTVGLRTHPLFNNHARYTYSIMILNPAGLGFRHLRDTRFIPKTQYNDEDAEKGMWLTEAGLELNHENTMGYIGNFLV